MLLGDCLLSDHDQSSHPTTLPLEFRWASMVVMIESNSGNHRERYRSIERYRSMMCMCYWWGKRATGGEGAALLEGMYMISCFDNGVLQGALQWMSGCYPSCISCLACDHVHEMAKLVCKKSVRGG